MSILLLLLMIEINIMIEISLGHGINIMIEISLLLSLLPFKDSNPISPLTASLHVLEEQPSIFLAAPS